MHDTPQLTPPCGGDHIIIGKFLSYGDFNPRPLAGATWASCPSDLSSSYFNPRPLAGATLDQIFLSWGHGISIHAPLRGRRRGFYNATTIAWISIHAPLRGRRCAGGRGWSVLDFNPRPLAGATER